MSFYTDRMGLYDNNYRYRHGNLDPAIFDILIGDAAFNLYRDRYDNPYMNRAAYRELEMRRIMQRRAQYLPTSRMDMTEYWMWPQPRW